MNLKALRIKEGFNKKKKKKDFFLIHLGIMFMF